MVVFLKSGGALRQRLKPDVDHYTRRVEVGDGTTVRQILLDIGVSPALVAFVYAGGRVRGLDHVPQDGESVTLQPPVSGG